MSVKKINTGVVGVSNGLKAAIAFLLLVVVGALSPLGAATTVTATALRKVTAVRETSPSTTNLAVWIDVPGATATFTIPAGSIDVFIARFTAESACSNGFGWCSVRILLNGVEMEPSSGTDFAFDSTDGATESSSSWEGHAMERSASFRNPYPTVPYNVTAKVQYCVTVAGTTFRLDDWHFTVEQLH